ncbi:MAG: hypothetical protein ABL962_14930, partial [Fimbriimonadaceae bacterium]
MTTLLYTILNGTEELPYSEDVLRRALAALDICSLQKPIPAAWTAIDTYQAGQTGRGYLGPDLRLEWNLRSGHIGSIYVEQNPMERPGEGDDRYFAAEALRSKALQAAVKLCDGYTVRYEQELEEGTRTTFQFSLVENNFPIGWTPGTTMTLNRRTGALIHFGNSTQFQTPRTLDVSNRLPAEQLRRAAEDAYLNYQPLDNCTVYDFGYRWCVPLVHLNNQPAPGLRYVAWFSPEFPERTPHSVLAYSVSFDWQSVIVDALTGRPIQIFGWDMGGRSTNTKQFQPEKAQWRVRTAKEWGKLKPTKSTFEGEGKRVSLVSDKKAIVLAKYD